MRKKTSPFSTYFGCKENVVLFRPNMFPSTNPFTHVLAGICWRLHALVFAGEELACEGTPQVFCMERKTQKDVEIYDIVYSLWVSK